MAHNRFHKDDEVNFGTDISEINRPFGQLLGDFGVTRDDSGQITDFPFRAVSIDPLLGFNPPKPDSTPFDETLDRLIDEGEARSLGVLGDIRARVDNELPLNPFSNEERQEQQNVIFDTINRQAESLSNQAAVNLNVRGFRGGGGQALDAFGDINTGRLAAQQQAFVGLQRLQEDFNNQRAIGRADVLGRIDQAQLDILAGSLEGRIGVANTVEIERIFQQAVKDNDEAALEDLITTVFQTATIDSDFFRSFSTAF